MARGSKKLEPVDGGSGGGEDSARPSESRGEWTYHRLREAIQAGELKPGERIREIEMAKRRCGRRCAGWKPAGC